MGAGGSDPAMGTGSLWHGGKSLLPPLGRGVLCSKESKEWVLKGGQVPGVTVPKGQREELGHGEPKGARGWCWGLGKPPLCLFPTTLWLWWVCRVLSCVVKGWEAPRWERGRCFPPLVSLGVPSHAEISGWVSKSCARCGAGSGRCWVVEMFGASRWLQLPPVRQAGGTWAGE